MAKTLFQKLSEAKKPKKNAKEKKRKERFLKTI